MAHDDELKDGKKVEVRDWVLHGSIIPLPLGPGMLLFLGQGTTLPAVEEFIAGNRLVGTDEKNVREKGQLLFLPGDRRRGT